MPPQRGTNFLADLLIDNGEAHLQIVLTNPFIDPEDNIEKVVIVTVRTYEDSDYDDDTCLIYPEDQPEFIDHTSYIYYRKAKLIETNELEAYIASHRVIFFNNLHSDVIAKIHDGMNISQVTIDEVNDFYQEYCRKNH